MFVQHFQINSIFCISVSLLIALFPYWNKTNIWISTVLNEISFWNFWRHSWDVGTQISNNYDFFCVHKYISRLTFLLKLGQYRDISSSGWEIFLKNFWRLSWNICILDRNNLEFFCMSVSLLVGLFPYWLRLI